MKSSVKLLVTLVAGLTTGAAAIHVLHAQGAVPSYVVTEIEDITDAAAFSVVTQRPQSEAAARVQQAGGRYVTRTDKITALDGTPPKRMIVIAFDSLEKAKAFNEIPSQKESTRTERKIQSLDRSSCKACSCRDKKLVRGRLQLAASSFRSHDVTASVVSCPRRRLECRMWARSCRPRCPLECRLLEDERTCYAHFEFFRV